MPIQLKTISDPEKKLAVYKCLMGDFFDHDAQLLTTGLEYAERLGARRLAPGQRCLDGYMLSTIPQT